MMRIAGSQALSKVCLLLGGAAVALSLGACGDLETKAHYPESTHRGPVYTDEKRETIFGSGGLDIVDIFSGKGVGRGGEGGGGGGLGVNSFLWRATLDTIAFMPLSSADPFGGVIITDWYTPPETPSERFKMSVYILGRELRADGVKVAVFRQRIRGNGAWVDSAIGKTTATNLENQILTRARQLRIASAK